jgi:Flp pilus assembly protein CpaB
MPDSALSKALRHMRRVTALQVYRDLADSELLERFLKERDEAAFAVVVERHGPIVLGVSRRLLGNRHDAEDVCQATFLVLARKAASIRKSTSLSSWLHGVTCRVAGRLKRERIRRQGWERRKYSPSLQDPGSEVSWREMQTILDEELERLPERYRAPLILCYLDGQTRDEAARRLGLSTGTLHGRLERGRELLRQRLSRRGLARSSALSATLLGAAVARAALAPTLAVATSRAALALATSEPLAESLISTSVLALTREALKGMFIAKLKLGTVATLACLAVAATCHSVTTVGLAQDAASPAKAVAQPVAKAPEQKAESDREFIRRTSLDLRGVEPTPTEIHFFLTSKDTDKRQKLIDLMIEERQAGVEAVNRLAANDFQRRDSNGDGFLNLDEMPADLKADLNRWDTNRDNLISPQEYRKYYANRQTQAKKQAAEDAARFATMRELLAEGYRAIGIRVPTQDIPGGLAALDRARVDVLWTVVRADPMNSSTRVLLEDVVVLAADDSDAQRPGTVLTLAVKPEDALKISMAREKGTLNVVVRREVVPEHVRLTYTDPTTGEATLRNLLVQSRELRVGPKKGFDTIHIVQKSHADGTKVVARAQVLRVDQRDVYFRAQDDVYGIHIGQNLANALRRPLTQAELDTLNLRPR